jgi:hypothetical protein
VNIRAKCTATLQTGDGLWVLLQFDPEPGHLIGEIPAAIGALETGKTYPIMIGDPFPDPDGTLPA